MNVVPITKKQQIIGRVTAHDIRTLCFDIIIWDDFAVLNKIRYSILFVEILIFP